MNKLYQLFNQSNMNQNGTQNNAMGINPNTGNINSFDQMVKAFNDFKNNPQAIKQAEQDLKSSPEYNRIVGMLSPMAQKLFNNGLR